jgi:MoaA/NifB/PqqE/SkfB family radical SAM enzyme
MTSVRETIRRYFTPHPPLPAGAYHYQSPADSPTPYRLHLRLEPDRTGVLIINAATVLHLNPTAAEYAYHFVKRTPVEETARMIASRYHVSRGQALQDFNDFIYRVQTLVETPDLDPVTYLDFDRTTPYTKDISAPYRLDCALTYRLTPGSDSTAAPSERVKRELSAIEWKTILDKAWDAGIPHIVFTGGEPTQREDLPELIAYAEAKGQVSGLLSDGLRLADTGYLELLLQTGLDHLMMVFQPQSEQFWTALKNVISADLFVAVHITLTSASSENSELLEKLSSEGVKAISLSAASHDLHDHLREMRDRAASLGLSLIWDLPVPYSSIHPIAIELAEEGREFIRDGAGHAWLYVEPDGDVLPAQGINQVLGNFLSDPWDKIWQAAKAGKTQP